MLPFKLADTRLLMGQFYLAWLAKPVKTSHLCSGNILTEDFWLTVPQGHPLFTRKRISLKDIKNETLLLLEDGHCLRDQTLRVCQLAGAKENTGFRATSLETLRYMVKAQSGITLMPTMAIRREPAIGYIPFENPRPQRTIALFRRKSSPRERLLKRIEMICRQASSDEESTAEASFEEIKSS